MEDIRPRVTPAGHQLLLERPPHPSQKLTDVVDGWAEQTMRTAINIELANYILNFGREIIVLEPPLLHDMVRDTIEYLSETYKALRQERALRSAADGSSKASLHRTGFRPLAISLPRPERD